MKKIQILFPILIIILSVYSCKKDDSSTTTSASDTASTGVPVISGATIFSGFLTQGFYTTITDTNTITTSSARASFSSRALPYMYIPTAITVNKVFFGNDSLTYSSTNKYYTSLFQPTVGVQTWSVTGANSIPTFSYTNASLQPTLAAVNLPDSVSKTASFTVTINNVSNSNSAYLTISDVTQSVNFSAQLNNGNNNITIIPANLSAMATGTGGNISISLQNNLAIHVVAKDFRLTKETQVIKQIKITP